MNLKKDIHGILLMDKPLHISSNGILQRVKRLFGAKKAGHTGSLDPLASGMLPICFGKATKLSHYLLESNKYYQVVMKLGAKTSTGDAEGEIIQTGPTAHITLDNLQAVIASFIGTIEQIPPMFSAIKHKGRPLYELARKGIEIERKPRVITIYELRLENWQDDCCHLGVHCSKGTYIRTLVEDIGEKLGCGAYVSELRRTAVAGYPETGMVSLGELESVSQQHGPEALLKYLLPLESVGQ